MGKSFVWLLQNANAINIAHKLLNLKRKLKIKYILLTLIACMFILGLAPLPIRERRANFMNLVNELTRGARFTKVIIHEIPVESDNVYYKINEIIKELRSTTRILTINAELSWQAASQRVPIDGYLVILGNVNILSSKTVDFSQSDEYILYDTEHRFYTDFSGEMIAVAFHKRGSRLAHLPVLFNSLSEATVFGRKNYKDLKLILALKKRADDEWEETKTSFYVYNRYRDTWFHFWQSFFAKTGYNEAMRLRHRFNLPDITGTRMAVFKHYKPYNALFGVILAICPACQTFVQNVPQTVVAPDSIGDNDTAVDWTVEGTHFLWFPRTGALFVIEGDKRREPTPKEVDKFERNKNKSDDPAFGTGARLAKSVIDVIDIGTRDGVFLVRIRDWLMNHGFENVEIVGIDNGDWLDDRDTVVKSTPQQKQAFVELADRVLTGQFGIAYRIFYADLFHHFPKSMIHSFDIVFINAPPQNMSVSWVHRSLRLIREDGIIVLRYEKNQRIFMNVSALLDFAKSENLSVRISNSDLPEGQTVLSGTAYFIKHGGFTWKATPLKATQYIQRQFEVGKPEEQAS